MKVSFYEISGIVAFILSWFGMLLSVYTQGRDKTKSISLHAAASKSTFLLLAVLSPITMGLYGVFTIRWITPMYNMPIIFVIASTAAYVGYILAAWVPATRGVKRKLHDIFSYGSSIVLIPVVYIMASTVKIGITPKIINVGALVIMVSVCCALKWYKPAKRNYLYYQIAYFLSFNIALLSVGFIK